MEPPTPAPDARDTDLERTVHQARREGAETDGLIDAVAASDDSLSEARQMAEDADEHIREARRNVDEDTEMSRGVDE